jgi:hypothetical protein
MQGRPKYRWEDNIKQDICQMKVKNWIICFQDRGKWKKRLLRRPKLSAIKEGSAPEEEDVACMKEKEMQNCSCWNMKEETTWKT